MTKKINTVAPIKKGNGRKNVKPPPTEIVDINQTPIIEPVFNGGTPKWLLKSYSSSGQLNIRLREENLVTCKICGATEILNPDEPNTCQQCDRPTKFTVQYGDIPKDYWRIPKWENNTEPIIGQELYQNIYDMVQKCVIFQREIEYKIFTLWTISTWKRHAWDYYGYLCFIGIPESGKTRALDILYYLGYRFTVPGCFTSKAMIRIGHKYQCGLNIDEAHSVLAKKKDNDLHMFVKTGYRKNSVYICAEKEKQMDTIAYNNAGFKAMAGEKNWNDDALKSRSILFFMEKDQPEVYNTMKVENELDELRSQLLRYRLFNNDPPELPEDTQVYGRKREIYQSILRTALHLGINYDDVVDYIKKQVQYKTEEEQQSDRFQILEIIKEFQTQETLDSYQYASVQDLCLKLGWIDDSSEGKELRQASQRLGYIFKDLDLHTKRQWIIDSFGKRKLTTVLQYDYQDNQERLAQLYRRYKL